MEVENSELARWARFTDQVRNGTLRLGNLLAGGKQREAEQLLMKLHLAAAQTLAAMQQAGAEAPAYLPTLPPLNLELLTSAANRRLYHALKEAYEAAIEVDTERGTYPYGSADFLAYRLGKTEREVYAPPGRDDC